MSSKYHKQVLRIVKKIYPINLICEEQNLGELCKNLEIPDYFDEIIKSNNTSLSSLRIDIYVKGQVAIEVHGEQHFIPVAFSNQILDPEAELARRQELDAIKQTALKLSGIPSVVIIYNEIKDLTPGKLKARICEAQLSADYKQAFKKKETKTGKFRTRDEAYKAKQKYFKELRNKKAREYRKKKYKELKNKKENK